MSNAINRDKLRGIVSDLQKLTGKKVTVTRVLMSKQDCYNAIYELMKLELGINTKKENETLKRLNKTLNEVNCEVNQDREELRKDLETLKKSFENLWSDAKEIFARKQSELEMYVSENKKLKTKNKALTMSWWIMLISLMTSVGVIVCQLFA